MKACKVCLKPEDCDCPCDTCLTAKVIASLPDHVYEMSEYSRKQWIYNQVQLLKGKS